jgi:IS30 family transposase
MNTVPTTKRLTAEEKLAMKSRRANGESIKSIAESMGRSTVSVWRAINNYSRSKSTSGISEDQIYS